MFQTTSQLDHMDTWIAIMELVFQHQVFLHVTMVKVHLLHGTEQTQRHLLPDVPESHSPHQVSVHLSKKLDHHSNIWVNYNISIT